MGMMLLIMVFLERPHPIPHPARNSLPLPFSILFICSQT